ncbi:MAG: PD40 domain-containing protein [Deltaproteobacteria bacterium]|nr:PD40 domain-containing protein [Deltaproteobacteria bacterium]
MKMILLIFLIHPAAVGSVFAFSVDVSRIYYADPAGTAGNTRQVDYDFTSGTISSNVISIPDTAVTKPPIDEELTYTFGPYDDPENDVAIQLNTASCTLTTSTQGGAIIATSPTLSTSIPLPEWTYEVRLQNFTGITDPGREYKTQIGMGSMTSGPNPEFSAIWSSEGTLEIYGDVYDDSLDSTIWSSNTATLTGLNINDTMIELRVALPARTYPGEPVIISFEYRVNGGAWTALNSYTITEQQLQQFFFLSFPGLFPYVNLEEDTGEEPYQVYSFHQNNAGGNKYYGSAFLNDPDQATYSSVSLSGTGCVTLSSTPMTYSNGQWWPDTGIALSENTPPSGCTQTFTINAIRRADGTTDTFTKAITGYVVDFATNLSPTGTINTTPTFSWTGISGADGYSVRLDDASYNQVWHSDTVPATQTSIVYDGPTLTNGQTYYYNVNAGIETDGSWNHSIAEGSFTYGNTISFSGWLKSSPNWPSTDGMLPVYGATVVGFDTTGSQIGQATSTATGEFTFTGIPSSSIFRFAIPTPQATDYVTVLSKFMSSETDIQALLPFVLFTQTQYDAFGNTTGTGMIVGRVALSGSPASFLAGATLLAEEWSGGSTTGTTYPVTYTSGSSTAADGLYMVKNVPSGTAVKLTATLNNYNFVYNGTIIPVYAGAVSEESFFATEIPAADQTVSGVLTGPAGSISDAKVEALSDGSVVTSTTTGVSGNYALTVPGNHTYTIRVTAAGYVRKVVQNISVGTSDLSVPDIVYTVDDADDDPPEIAYMQPEAGQLVGGAQPTISAVLSDAKAGIDLSTIGMRIDGNDVTPDFDSETGTVTYIPEGEGLSDGPHQVTLDVRDYASNPATQAQWTFTVKLPIIVQYERTRVTDSGEAGDGQPAWKPDGRKIAFTSNRSGNYDIWTVNPDGTGLIRLTTSDMDEKYPSWSPDGTKIAYVTFDPNKGIWGGYHLSTMNADGTGQALHYMPQTDPQSEDTFWQYEVIFTQWIDNHTILFVSFGPDGGNHKIYRYNLDISSVQDITPATEINPFGVIYNISYSSAKNLLAYDRWPVGIQTITPVVTNTDYAVMDIPRANQMDTPAMPGWSPDGKKMAFVKNLYSGESNIAIYDQENQTTTINQTTENDRWAAWSPGGDKIAIVSGPEYPDNGSIWLLTLYTVLKGDLNGDASVDLSDLVVALQVLTGKTASNIRSDYAISGTDVNGDGRIGVQELEYILQVIGGLR